jgi:hypothetical protein
MKVRLTIIIVLFLLGIMFLYFLPKKHYSYIPSEAVKTAIETIMITPLPSSLSQYEGVSFFTPYHKFFLKYPKECSLVSLPAPSDFNNPVIKCKAYTDSFIMIPQSGGHAAEVSIRDVVTIGSITWYRSIFRRNETESESFGFASKEGTYYVIEIQYDRYSSDAKNLAYSILSSFSYA